MYIHSKNMNTQRSIRKIAVTGPGKTYYFTVPRQMIKELNWRKGEKKIIFRQGDKLVIEDWIAE